MGDVKPPKDLTPEQMLEEIHRTEETIAQSKKQLESLKAALAEGLSTQQKSEALRKITEQ